MTMEQLREAHRAKPFKPFRICLADGRSLPVQHPEFLTIIPGASRTFVLGTPDEIYRIVDLLMVVSLDFENGRTRPDAQFDTGPTS